MAKVAVTITGLDVLRKVIENTDWSKIIVDALKKQLEKPELLCPICHQQLEICVGGEWKQHEADNFYYIACGDCNMRTWGFDTKQEAVDLVRSWSKK